MNAKAGLTTDVLGAAETRIRNHVLRTAQADYDARRMSTSRDRTDAFARRCEFLDGVEEGVDRALHALRQVLAEQHAPATLRRTT